MSAAAPESDGAAPACQLLLQDAQGHELFSCAAPEGMTFGIRYIHSVARSPVTDWFMVSDQTIFLEKTVYEDFGAGLPHAPEAGQTMSTCNGKIIISGYHRPLPSFDVRVGRIAQHTLLLPKAEQSSLSRKEPCAEISSPQGQKDATDLREIPLAQLARAGSAITISLRPQ